jgi:tRNA-2-methylthio-N6-dimethylallyladenosine synthase
MSTADSSEMAQSFLNRGFASGDSLETADAVVVSTCTVREHAENRALSFIGRLKVWKKKNPKRLLIVAGCAAERLGSQIRARFPHVDLVIGAKSIENFSKIIEEALSNKFDLLKEDVANFKDKSNLAIATGASGRTCDFVTIMRGCNYSCSYCIVPLVRGRERYRPVEEIINDVKSKVAQGVKEIMLLGQTVNSYQADYQGKSVRFPDLLRLLDDIQGLLRLRFMSPHPHYVTKDMISAIKDCPSVCEYLHLPLQSGSDRILKLMRRNYSKNIFLDKVRALRKEIPGIVLSTDIIVGFPTETEADFEETLSFLKEFRPAWIYSFKYSLRPGTPCASEPDDVPTPVKEKRLARLMELARELGREPLKDKIGQTVEVLEESENFGRTRDGFKVKWSGSEIQGGRLLSIKVVAASDFLLTGEIQ